MFSIYVDDVRTPVDKFDAICRNTTDAVKVFRRKYKEGRRHFLLDLDHDAGDNAPGGDFINILKDIDSYVRLGKMKDLGYSLIICESLRNLCPMCVGLLIYTLKFTL